MKSFMMFLNFVTFLVVGLLVFVHVVHKEPQPESVLSLTPDSPTNKIEPPIQNNPPFTLPSTDTLVNTNIFHPDRGKVPEPEAVPAVPPVKSETLELVGIFKFGGKMGAIIKEQASAVKKPAEAGDSTRKVFYLNDKMPNGCLLKKVEASSVVMEQNGTEFTLVLDIADKGSQDRQKNVPAIKPSPVLMNPKATPAPGTPATQPPTPPGVKVTTPPQPQATPAKPGVVVTPVPPPPPAQVKRGRFTKK